MNLRDQSVVVMPAAHRPEFAALALERLGKASNCPAIMLNIDDVSEKLKGDFTYVHKHYAPFGTCLTFRPPHVQASSGCFNILESIRDGYDSGAQYVFLVEEDILVWPDFFEYHWEQMTVGAVVSCGRRCARFWTRCPGMYTNPGSCLSREFLDKLIPHINNDFYKATGPYMDRVLGQVEGIHGLDDGLIRRVLWKHELADRVVYPPADAPRCAHTGFIGYENHYDFCHRDDVQGIQWQIDNLRTLLKEIDRQGPKGKYVKDLDWFPPELL